MGVDPAFVWKGGEMVPLFSLSLPGFISFVFLLRLTEEAATLVSEGGGKKSIGAFKGRLIVAYLLLAAREGRAIGTESPPPTHSLPSTSSKKKEERKKSAEEEEEEEGAGIEGFFPPFRFLYGGRVEGTQKISSFLPLSVSFLPLRFSL